MRVVAAGMHRSGSTLLYNVLRMILSQDSTVYSAFLNLSYDAAEAAEYDHQVIKVHRFNSAVAKTADFIFMTRRDLRDVAASSVRHKKLSPLPTPTVVYCVKVMRREHDPWLPHVSMVIPYHLMMQDKVKCIRRIAAMLKQEVNAAEVHASVEALKSTNMFDPVTQLHPNHITDGRVGSYRETLPQASVDAINLRCKSWLKKYGYLKETM